MAGLASALATARAGHCVTLIDRDPINQAGSGASSFNWDRKGIPHFHQPHAFLPRGRSILQRHFPDVLNALREAGAEEIDVSRKIPGARLEADSELTFLGVRRPLIEWALRDAVLREESITIIPCAKITGLLGEHGAVPRPTGVITDARKEYTGDVVVDAMGRNSPMAKWVEQLGAAPIPEQSSDCGLIYYSRYFRFLSSTCFPEGPWLLSPRGDLGYAMFSTFIGDSGTFAAFIGIPTYDNDLRIIQQSTAFMAACGSIHLLAPLVDPSYAEPISTVMPMGGLRNTLREYVHEGKARVIGLFPAGDALCHTDPSFALGLSLSLLHATDLVAALAEQNNPESQTLCYLSRVEPEMKERFALACAVDDARIRLWKGEPLDFTRRDGCYPLFQLIAPAAVARQDADIFRKTMRRIGFLDRTAVFDQDVHMQIKVESLFAKLLASGLLPKQGPSRDELFTLLKGVAF